MEVVECPVNQEEFARKRSVERAFPVEGKALKEKATFGVFGTGQKSSQAGYIGHKGGSPKRSQRDVGQRKALEFQLC